MGEEMAIGCARPTGGPVGEAVEESTSKGRTDDTSWQKGAGFFCSGIPAGKIYIRKTV